MPAHPRLAQPADAPEIVRLRALMFESMGQDASDLTWRTNCRAHLEAELRAGRMVGVVVDAPEGPGLAACGVAEVSVRVPSPRLPDGSSAYVGSMSTDLHWRRQGMARAILERLLDELTQRGVMRIELHATPEGEPLYESLGFLDRHGGREMRLGR
jgi:GNAT superfamily N-acetyltransferase